MNSPHPRKQREPWSVKTPRAPMDCHRCGEPLPLLRHYKQYICESCATSDAFTRRKCGYDAHKMVQLAIKLGYLRPPSECACVDCGESATEYEHRDYNKPLEVDPTCRSCNFKRGPAAIRRS